MNLTNYWLEKQEDWTEVVKNTELEQATIEWRDNPPVTMVCRPGYCGKEFISYWVGDDYQQFCCADCEVDSDEQGKAEAYFDAVSEAKHEFYLNAHQFGLESSPCELNGVLSKIKERFNNE